MLSNTSFEGKPAAARVRVRELCARRKCSLRRAAAEMGISPSLLSNYQTGKIGPGLKQLLVMSRFFNTMRLDELIEIRDGRSVRMTHVTRIRPFYTQIVNVPREIQPLMWDCPDGKASLEKVVLRVLTHGDFALLRVVCRKFPAAARHVATTYRDIRRGVRYWVRRLERERRRA